MKEKALPQRDLLCRSINFPQKSKTPCIPSLIKYPSEVHRKTSDKKWWAYILSLRLAAWIKPDFWERWEYGTKRGKIHTCTHRHRDNIHCLVLQSLPFKFTPILFCAFFQIVQSPLTLIFELTIQMGNKDHQKVNLLKTFFYYMVMI